MAVTYTSPYGNTAQGTQLQGGVDALSTIKGMAQNISSMQQGEPQRLADIKSSVSTQQGLPGAIQAQGNVSDAFSQLAAAHQGLEAQYGGSQGGGGLNLTMPSDIRGFNPIGMTDPRMNTQAAQSDTDASMSLLKSLDSFITSGYQNVKGAQSAEQQTFRDVLSTRVGMIKDALDAIKQSHSDTIQQHDLQLRERDQFLREWQAGLVDRSGKPLSAEEADKVTEYAQKITNGQMDVFEVPPAYQRAVENTLKAAGWTQAQIDKFKEKRYQLKKNVGGVKIPILNWMVGGQDENYDPKTGAMFNPNTGVQMGSVPTQNTRPPLSSFDK